MHNRKPKSKHRSNNHERRDKPQRLTQNHLSLDQCQHDNEQRKITEQPRQRLHAISQQLRLVPKGFSLAPANDEFSEVIRQMIVGRYRVLFTIRKHKVHVLHVRGASLRASKGGHSYI